VTAFALDLPGKILCVGRNYADHAKELGHDVPAAPLFFLKPPSSVIWDGDAIVRPNDLSSVVHHEGELAVVIGKKLTRAASEADALAAIRGYTCANDVTARDLQKKDGQWTRAKGFDTFCPLLRTGVTLDDAGDLALTVRVNGTIAQRARTSTMIFSVARILVDASRAMTLLPGDIVLTGTPAGVGPLLAGDVVEVEIERVGILSNPVRDLP
jgi:2-keto-4-pentenoate hydratase/2-oxohepta-3-ene-1,7-dioic acid hydratase in catechol pathway